MNIQNNNLFNPDDYFDDRIEEGVCRVDRSIFTDEAIFELEIKNIFEANWVYLAHESQITEPNDFFSTWIGRQPVLLTRNAEGEVKAFINACAHRGVTLTREDSGNRAEFSCPFHGWTFNTNGDNIGVMLERGGGYPDSFCKKDMGLTPLPRLGIYRGFIFGALASDIPDIEEHLGDVTHMIDLMVDQSPDGLEVLPGYSTYTYRGNWKVQAENGVDGYHVYATHGNYVMTTEHRKELRAEKDAVKAMPVGEIGRTEAGFFDFGHGHVTLYGMWPDASDRAIYPNLDDYKSRYGEEKANWMVSYIRNTLLYPNVFLMDQMSSQIRVFRPLAVDKTEVTIFCIAPVGENPEARNRRIRQYEDFFNASGMATPDDLAEFNAAQDGFNGRAARWNDLRRGITRLSKGPNDVAQRLGINPVTCGTQLDDEGIMIAQHRYWRDCMSNGNGA
jgi:benzoate/toluate 1,2-dioxygenase alpha subunit